uniref:V-SNARE coiled-coil homology domain-containing protein n=1 Tax=Haptolina ericina TaxID=156174 RepID=A0A7S3BB69_9EUKA|mmetsp:Transcript_5440/g.11749  ORF Transcript_5440/g.11749 Transcript_5440/m.11749 type:complete len:101 (+) Transcript_5440:86-388(+)
MDKFSRVQDDLDEATEIMRHNIERVVDRGEHLELLVDKSEGFSNSARQFQKHSSGLRQALWWKNFKTVAMCSSFAFTLILAVLYFKCGWAFSKCRAGSTA